MSKCMVEGCKNDRKWVSRYPSGGIKFAACGRHYQRFPTGETVEPVETIIHIDMRGV